MKKASLVGINYFGTACELNGCHNDIHNIRDTLLKLGFDNENISVMLDSKSGRGKQEPTRENILNLWKNLIDNAKPGDLLYIHYSGHGSYTMDIMTGNTTMGGSNDEQDGQDETICPCDDKHILDDELFSLLVLRLPDHVKLRVVFDCCHSGSALDLPNRYQYGVKFFTENRHVKNKDVIMISGCRDNQTSADAWEEGNYTGALTWALLKAVNYAIQYNPKMNWKEFLQEIRRHLLKKKYQQIPQLSLSSRFLLTESVDIY